MTRKTLASLQSRLSTGDAADNTIPTEFVKDITDSFLDLDTYEAANVANAAGTGSTRLNVAQVLWTLSSADMNVTTDQDFTKVGTFGNFIIIGIRAYDASTSLTTAVGGIYEAASKGGTAIVANSQAYSALTAATLGLDLTVAAHGKDVLNSSALYLSLTTPQGGAATAGFYVIGIPLTAS